MQHPLGVSLVGMPFFQKRLRRPAEHYRGRQIYFVTVGTERRAPFFEDQSTGEWLLRHLLETAAQRNFSLHAYCIMPDHVHCLCEGLSDTSDLVQFVGTFKQRTAYEFKKTHGGRPWQTPHSTPILRPEEVLEGGGRYLLWNPVSTRP